jgi:hypothetical protein
MATAKEKALNAALEAASRPKETRRGNEMSAARLTLANQFKRGLIGLKELKKKM